MNLEPIDPEWLKADLYRALSATDAGRTGEAVAAVEAYVAKLRALLANLDEIQAAFPSDIPTPPPAPPAGA